jgi:hypothetical protein
VNDTKPSLVDKKMSFVVFHSVTKGGIKFNFGLRPSDYSNCFFEISNSTGATGYRLVDSSNQVQKKKLFLIPFYF